jgi:hypothetical protein
MAHRNPPLDQVALGTWHYDAGAEAAAGAASIEGSVTTSSQGYRAFKTAEGGTAATVTARGACETVPGLTMGLRGR